MSLPTIRLMVVTSLVSLEMVVVSYPFTAPDSSLDDLSMTIRKNKNYRENEVNNVVIRHLPLFEVGLRWLVMVLLKRNKYHLILGL